MKTSRLIPPVKALAAIVCTFACLTASGLAQTVSNSFPTVVIYATTPNASFAGKPGVFSVFRQGDPTNALNVYYCISGTASNGVDYQTIGHFVSLPSMVISNSITINPINHGQSNVETVVIDLCQSPTLQPVNYSIGSPSEAVVYISPASNSPPVVRMVNPTNGAVYKAPVNIPLFAQVSDPDGTVTHVEFFAGSMDLGSGQELVLDPPGVNGVTGPVFYLNWSNVPPNSYSLTAVATDNGGASTVSAPVNVRVLPAGTNQPPVVSIINPTNGAAFKGPVNIPLYAQATDPDDAISNVEFFAGSTDLGSGQLVSMGPQQGGVYALTWSNVPPGSFPLTAVATDNSGLSTVSDVVNINVFNSSNNLPPIVRITSPPNGATFRAPTDIPIFAYAADLDGYVTSVQFFADGNSLGFGRPISPVVAVAQPGAYYFSPSNFWFLVWTNPVSKTNVMLTALATDNGGTSTLSAPIEISVLPPLPPPTNRPPLVGIIARDPVAIEGTNCWPWICPVQGGSVYYTNSGYTSAYTPTASTWNDWSSQNTVFRLITNCGPKDATFTVFRFGVTNDDLNISYAIGGTATNGFDYVALSGSVLIPAGERSANITVIPIDDGPPDITSTVILKLIPGTNYLLGLPRAAGAVILDPGSPRPITGVLPGGFFHICADGPDGAWFHVEQSADMINWTPICTNQVVNGSIDFVDPDAATQPSVFYRTVPEANPPAL